MAELKEVGQVGIRINNGVVSDEYVPELKGRRAVDTYKRMRDTETCIEATLSAINLSIKSAIYDVKPSDESSTAYEYAELVKGMLFEDMEHTWNETLDDLVTCMQFGWAVVEAVPKVRQGDNKDPYRNSKFDDGLIGVKKLALRRQETIYRWMIDENDNVIGIEQLKVNGGIVQLPFDNGMLGVLHFKSDENRGNPEGRSILRSSYDKWYKLRTAEAAEIAGVDRGLNGLGVMRVPQEWMAAEAAGDAQAKVMLDNFRVALRDVKANMSGGLMLPSDTYKDGNGSPTDVRMVDFDLVSSKFASSIDARKTVQALQIDIMRSMLADFLVMGTGQTGNRAARDSATDFFTKATESYLDKIVGVINRKLIPNIWRVNNLPKEYMPCLTYDGLVPVDLAELGQYIKDISGAGMPLFPDDSLEAHLREKGGLPAKDMDEVYEDGEQDSESEQE